MARRSPQERIYLDHAATTAVRSEVYEAMAPFLRGEFGNPSSLHTEGKRARDALENARQEICDLAEAQDFRFLFTGSGTESDNSALIGAVLAARASKSGAFRWHVVTTAIEHAAVLETIPVLESLGATVTVVDVDPSGQVRPEAVAAALRDETILVSVMAVNNETGVIQDIQEIARLARHHGALFHTDAIQLVGKLPLSLKEIGADLVSLSGHKIYGPKGIAGLFIRRDCPWSAVMRGGGQEDGLRAGTENVAGAIGLAQAMVLAEKDRASVMSQLEPLRDRLQTEILSRLDAVVINGVDSPRVPTVLNLSLPRVGGEALVGRLDHLGVAISTGSACNVGSHKPSHVLKAMGRSEREVRGSVRFSLGRENDSGQIDRAIEAFVHATQQLEAMAPES